jgi:hypothetical protein
MNCCDIQNVTTVASEVKRTPKKMHCVENPTSLYSLLNNTPQTKNACPGPIRAHPALFTCTYLDAGWCLYGLQGELECSAGSTACDGRGFHVS